MPSTEFYTANPCGEMDGLMLRHAGEAAADCVRHMGATLASDNLDAFLRDPQCPRVPVHVVFTEEGIGDGAFANTLFYFSNGERRCALHVHPIFEGDAAAMPAIVAYMAAAINYGALATEAMCEAYGAALVMETRGTFRKAVTALRDRVALKTYGGEQYHGVDVLRPV